MEEKVELKLYRPVDEMKWYLSKSINSITGTVDNSTTLSTIYCHENAPMQVARSKPSVCDTDDQHDCIEWQTVDNLLKWEMNGKTHILVISH